MESSGEEMMSGVERNDDFPSDACVFGAASGDGDVRYHRLTGTCGISRSTWTPRIAWSSRSTRTTWSGTWVVHQDLKVHLDYPSLVQKVNQAALRLPL